MKCCKGRPTPVGLPFLICLPSSLLTYTRLASMAEKFARYVCTVTGIMVTPVTVKSPM